MISGIWNPITKCVMPFWSNAIKIKIENQLQIVVLASLSDRENPLEKKNIQILKHNTDWI